MATITHNVRRTRTGRPAIRTTQDVMDLWAERLQANTLHQLAQCERSGDKDSISFHGDTLTHYGHFPLARILRRKSGRIELVLLNGDSYSSAGFGPSTSSRQGDVRRIVNATDHPSMVVPFSALDAAGILPETIRPIEVRDDRRETIWITVDERPGLLLKIHDPSGATYEAQETRWGYTIDGEPVERDGHFRYPEGSTYGEYTVSVTKPVLVDDPTRATVERGVPAHGWCYEAATLQDDGSWKFPVERHWLGDSVFSAMVRQTKRSKDGGVRFVRRGAIFLSSFDYGEPHRPYFMCELPKGARPNTVDEAIECLMPTEVEQAIARGLTVLRQGDVFAIETALPLVHLQAVAKPATRTIHKYVEELGPNGYTVGRHEREEREETIRRFKADGFKREDVDIHGTNHRATRLIVTKNGEQFAQGRMYHAPRQSWRRPDHRVVTLGDGKTWFKLVKNTVPLDKASGSSRGSATVFQSGDSRAWTLGGVVD